MGGFADAWETMVMSHRFNIASYAYMLTNEKASKDIQGNHGYQGNEISKAIKAKTVTTANPALLAFMPL